MSPMPQKKQPQSSKPAVKPGVTPAKPGQKPSPKTGMGSKHK